MTNRSATDAALSPTCNTTLREKAEAQWQAIRQKSPDTFGDLTLRDTDILLHDLQVHQIELEMQNEELRRARDALGESRQRYIELYDQAPVGYCSVDDGGRIIRANLTLAKMLGLQSIVLTSRLFSDLVFRDDQDKWYLVRRLLPADSPAQIVELRLRLDDNANPWHDGRCLWVQLTITLEHNGSGATLMHLAVNDISARKLADARLQLAASVFDHAREAIMITDASAALLDVNDAFTRVTGYYRSEVIGRNPRILKSGRQDQLFYETMWRNLTSQGYWSGEIWNRRKSGEVFASLLTISAVRDARGKTQHYVGLFSDITAIKTHQSQLEHMAHFDALTNLPNRLLLADRLQQAMAQVLRRQKQLAVVYIDLDGFKAINDHHGHDVGDQMLITLTQAMKETLREGDTLARLGGDEFAAVLVDLDNAASSAPMLVRLLVAAAAPVQLGEKLLQSSASMGVTFYPQAQSMEGDQLLRQADQAMYHAKLAGKNRYMVFDAENDSLMRIHHESLERIRQAMAQSEFVLYYQPKVNMRSGLIVGAEALIRWQHPDKGLLSPAAFLPVIEDHPLAVRLGEWVIDSALSQIERWHAAGLSLPVSVNVGARQLQQADFVARLQALLAAHPNVSPTRLTIEVLETSALADMAQVSQVIEDCARIGVMFALDDFGTGYSSLTYLKRLRVKQLKMDQSFVNDMLDDPDDMAILQGVIGLAEAFHREVIAEGVETVAQGAALLQMGCELAQGYGIARPMHAGAMPGWCTGWQRAPVRFEGG